MEPIIEIIDINVTNQVRVTISEFRGKLRLDIRHFWKDGVLIGDPWKPSKKGINVGEAEFDELRKCIDRVISKAAVGE